MTSSNSPQPALLRGRLCLLLAAVLWSTSGAFTKVLREETSFGLNQPPVRGEQMAFFRTICGGIVLATLLRRGDIAFRPAMIGAAISFAIMNYLFVRALAEGKAANAIFLQYSASLWMYLVSIFWLGEAADLRGGIALALGLSGIGLIIAGGWSANELPVVAIALGSGVAYAGVLIFLRVLRGMSALWLTVVNLLFSGLVLVPIVWSDPMPTGPQLVVLVLYGVVQLAIPYWLVAHGLRVVSPQEAGTICLVEPLLNPVWAYLASPATERLSGWTLAGGACIIGALAYRYWPFREETASEAKD